MTRAEADTIEPFAGEASVRPCAVPMVEAPMSLAELLDKITILELKMAFFESEEQLKNVQIELDLLSAIERRLPLSERVSRLREELKVVNGRLWSIEDRIRSYEQTGLFDEDFIAMARAIHVANDQRAAIKREINHQVGSALVEEKDYAGQKRTPHGSSGA